MGAARMRSYESTRARLCRADVICKIIGKRRSDVNFWKEHDVTAGLEKGC